MLASDFDRTFYVDGVIPKKNIQAVRRWREHGNLFVIATGREERILREKLDEYGVKADYLICNNGSRIVDRAGKILFQKTMDKREACSMTEFLLEEYRIPVDVTGTNRRVQVTDGSHAEQETIRYNGILETVSLDEFKNKPEKILQVHVRFSNKEETRHAAEQINACYSGSEAFVNEDNADIVSRGLGKAEGIGILCRCIGFTGTVTAIGDSYNDLGMLRRYQGCTLEAANAEIRQEIDESRIFQDVADCLDCLSRKK